MIFDVLDNAEKYYGLHSKFSKAFEFIRDAKKKDLEAGTYEIDGDNLYSNVIREIGRTTEKALLETHEKYIDIQVVVGGIDNMGWRSRGKCQTIKHKYDDEKDVQLYSDEPEMWVETKPEHFAIFFPEDAHMPMISDDHLYKIVVKVRVE